MILPIHVYPDPVLRAPTEDVEADSPELQQLVDDLIETLHRAAGIGLAAPQVGRNLRLFVIDLRGLMDDLDEAERAALPPQPMVFINPEIVDESHSVCEFEEGCLSIPDIREAVERPERVQIRFQDRDMQQSELFLAGLLARVVQHEYDHLEGILFVDRISPFKRRLLRRRLREMAKGAVEADYPILQSRV